MYQVNGKAEISTPHSSRIFQPILMKLETKKDIRDTTPHAKIWLIRDDGKGVCVGKAFSVTFCVPSIYLIFVYLPSPTGHTRRPITTVYGSKRVFPRKVGSFGGLDNKK